MWYNNNFDTLKFVSILPKYLPLKSHNNILFFVSKQRTLICIQYFFLLRIDVCLFCFRLKMEDNDYNLKWNEYERGVIRKDDTEL